MHIVDSSLIIAFFRESESDHKQAIRILSSLSDFIITDYILLEISAVLFNRESKSVAKKAINLLTSSPDIKIIRLNDDELTATINLFKKETSNLSFVDMSLVVLRKTRKARVHTFDKALKRALVN